MKVRKGMLFPFKRRRMKRTDYRLRLKLLKSGQPRFVVRKALNNVHIQLIKYDEIGDRTLVEDFSKSLKKFGWKAHCGSIPAAYLTGLLVGLKCLEAGIKEAVLDIGLQTSTKQSSLYAAVRGALDAGMAIPVNKRMLPNDSRIAGTHIAEFARKLKAEAPDRYKQRFSACLKAGLDPETMNEHFAYVKKEIQTRLVS